MDCHGLRKVFDQFGPAVKSIKMGWNDKFAFVKFSDSQQATTAMETLRNVPSQVIFKSPFKCQSTYST